MEDKTKQKIQELVPEIMELEFGCRFYFKGSMYGCIVVNSSVWKYIAFMVQIPHLEAKYDRINRRDIINDIVILGRPITLADVLLAMEKIGKYILVDVTGNLFTHDMSDGALVDEGIWDLTKNYDDQEQSVKDFIGNVLGVK